MMDKKFIMTDDEEFKVLLSVEGYKLITRLVSSNRPLYIFENKPSKLKFDKKYSGKYSYTNRLFL